MLLIVFDCVLDSIFCELVETKSYFQSFMYPVLKNSINVIKVAKLTEMCEKELNLSDEA